MINLAQAKQDIEKWMVEFVEVPHPALGGWAPCPFARQARLNQTFEILLGQDPVSDLKNQSLQGMSGLEVIIYVYDPAVCSRDQLDAGLAVANQDFLLPRGLIALGDHPEDLERVNGICMNQGTYAMVLVQSLSELDSRAAQIAAKGFYTNWPADYLKTLFDHRKDPR